MDENTKPQHTPTLDALRAMHTDTQLALSSNYFKFLFAHTPVVALEAYDYLSQLPKAMVAYEKCALANPTHARIALETITQNETLPFAEPILLTIQEKYPRMVAQFAGTRGIQSPKVIAAMVRSGKLDIDLDNPHGTRVLANLAEVTDSASTLPDTRVEGLDRPQRAGTLADGPDRQIGKR